MSENIFGDSDSSSLPERIQAQQKLILLDSRKKQLRRELAELLNSSGPEAPADPAKVRSLIQREDEISREAVELILALIESIGFPTSDLVGKTAAACAWNFLSFQNYIADNELQLINDAIQLQPECEIPNLYMRAVFQDRVMLQLTNEQLFGSIWNMLSIGDRTLLVPYPIKDTESVDKRRAEHGLSPLFLFALSRLAPEFDGEVLLPASYALNLGPTDLGVQDHGIDLSEPPGATDQDVFYLMHGQGPWSGIPLEILRRKARLSDCLENLKGSVGETKEEVDPESDFPQIVKDNFTFILELCQNPDLGFPTDEKVGISAARAAFEMVLTYAMLNGESLEEVLKAVSASASDSVAYPGPAEVASLTDMWHSQENGLQIYGAAWVATDQTPQVIAPIATQDILNIDSRRASMGLIPWYQYAMELEEILTAIAYLPVEYFGTFPPRSPENDGA